MKTQTIRIAATVCLALVGGAAAYAQQWALARDPQVPTPEQHTAKAKATVDPKVDKLRSAIAAVHEGPPSPADYVDHIATNVIPAFEEATGAIEQETRQLIDSEHRIARAVAGLEAHKKGSSPRVAAQYQPKIDKYNKDLEVMRNRRKKWRDVRLAVAQAADRLLEDVQVELALRRTSTLDGQAQKIAGENAVKNFDKFVADYIHAAETDNTTTDAQASATR